MNNDLRICCSATTHLVLTCTSLLAFLLFVGGCKNSSTTVTTPPVVTPVNSAFPPDFPPIVAPANNPMTPAKIALGRVLFYEKRLSVNGTQACAGCHSESSAFCDVGHPVSTGALGIINGGGNDSAKSDFILRGTRNAPGLANVAYNTSYFWDGRAATLEQQALMPIQNPAELANTLPVVVKTLANDTMYQRLFTAAFGDPMVDTIRLGQAIATFERTLISGYSAYDDYNRGNKTALSASAIHGLTLFVSDSTNCSKCHSGFNFTDNRFHSTGLDQSYSDLGRFLITNQDQDNGSFKTPSLRNVALTSPYEHDGRFTVLEQVIEHYNIGGMHNKAQDTLIKQLNLNNDQVEALVAFLESLTDKRFVTNPAFAAP